MQRPPVEQDGNTANVEQNEQLLSAVDQQPVLNMLNAVFGGPGRDIEYSGDQAVAGAEAVEAEIALMALLKLLDQLLQAVDSRRQPRFKFIISNNLPVNS